MQRIKPIDVLIQRWLPYPEAFRESRQSKPGRPDLVDHSLGFLHHERLGQADPRHAG